MEFNIIAFLILAAWLFSGLWALEKVDRTAGSLKGAGAVLLPWLSLLCLISGPVIPLVILAAPQIGPVIRKVREFALKDRSGLEIIKDDSSVSSFGGIVFGNDENGASGAAGDGYAPLKRLLAKAVSAGTTDLNIDFSGGKAAVRTCTSGRWSSPQKLDGAEQIINELKECAALPAGAGNRPAEGGFQLKLRKKLFDVGVSVLPTVGGESLSVFIAEAVPEAETPAELGVSEADLTILKQVLASGASLVLIGGTEKSGRSKTLRTVLKTALPAGCSIALLESSANTPVVDGVMQMRADTASGVTMASLLNAVINQHPGVIAVDELSGKEAMAGVFRAVDSGITVIAVVEADDLPGTVNRLFGMGAAPADLSRTLSLVIYQQLTGRLCRSCAVPEALPDYLRDYFGAVKLPENGLRKAAGCRVCRNSGYRGFCGVFEFYRPGAALQSALNAMPVQQTAVRRAIDSETEGVLTAGALRLAAAGIIPLADVERLERPAAGGEI